ncbi:MAG TPA: carboxypeptidase-like regulatory domain-containing protein [Bacteroidia bacterium]|nr:carboxypeptidase-like regulatory domain-containing protein [Bacteroidia bacterium]
MRLELNKCRILFSLLAFIIFESTFAQTVVTGHVYEDDSGKEPIPMATIWIKGTKIGCISDSLGYYSLVINSVMDTARSISLFYSYVNHEVRQISFSPKAKRFWTMDVALKAIPSCNYPESQNLPKKK